MMFSTVALALIATPTLLASPIQVASLRRDVGALCNPGTNNPGDLCDSARNCVYKIGPAGYCVPTLVETGLSANDASLAAVGDSCTISTSVTVGDKVTFYGTQEPKWAFHSAIFDGCDNTGCKRNDPTFKAKKVTYSLVSEVTITAITDGDWNNDWESRNFFGDFMRELIGQDLQRSTGASNQICEKNGGEGPDCHVPQWTAPNYIKVTIWHKCDGEDFMGPTADVTMSSETSGIAAWFCPLLSEASSAALGLVPGGSAIAGAISPVCEAMAN